MDIKIYEGLMLHFDDDAKEISFSLNIEALNKDERFQTIKQEKIKSQYNIEDDEEVMLFSYQKFKNLEEFEILIAIYDEDLELEDDKIVLNYLLINEIDCENKELEFDIEDYYPIKEKMISFFGGVGYSELFFMSKYTNRNGFTPCYKKN